MIQKWTYNDHKKLPNSGDLVGVTPHPSDPAQAFPHISYPHCQEAEIWYGDLTHKYKMIQGVKTKLNPIPQGGDLNLTFLFKGFQAL